MEPSTPVLPTQVTPPELALSDAAPHAIVGVEVVAVPVLPGDDDTGPALGPGAEELSEQLGADLLALARATEDTDPSDCDPVDLREVFQDCVDLLSVQAEVKRMAIALDLPGDPLPVRGEVGDLEQIASNLVGNAVKYSPDGSTVTVVLASGEAEHGHDEVVVAVSDQGIGISPEDQARLFEEFFRSDDPAACRQPGTGLGLAIVKRVVDRLCGTIAVDSAPGEGSTFTVCLPRAVD